MRLLEEPAHCVIVNSFAEARVDQVGEERDLPHDGLQSGLPFRRTLMSQSSVEPLLHPARTLKEN